jgi:hypothetical protein
MEITVLNCDTEADIETAFAIAVSQRINAVYAGVGAFFVSRREQIAALAIHHRLPTMSVVREAALAGQLMSYSTRIEDGYRQAGVTGSWTFSRSGGVAPKAFSGDPRHPQIMGGEPQNRPLDSTKTL